MIDECNFADDECELRNPLSVHNDQISTLDEDNIANDDDCLIEASDVSDDEEQHEIICEEEIVKTASGIYDLYIHSFFAC